jgi:hypothetical protein
MVNKFRIVVKYLFAFAMVLLFKTVYAQKLQSKSEIISTIIEKLIENSESTIDYTDLQAQFEYYYDNKLNLNKITDYELRQLIFLKQSEVLSIINHKKLYGDFENIYELQAIANLSDESIFFLKHFVTVTEGNKQLKLSEIKEIGKTEIVFQHENDFEQRDVYEVETILAKRFNRLRKRLEYFIVWKNYKKSEGTWEGLENLDGCFKKVKEFELNSIPGHCINSLINEGENERPLKRKFGVQKIISSRTNNIRKVNEYLVSFNGFEKFEWIDSKNLLNCEYLKKDFENRSYDIFSIRKL